MNKTLLMVAFDFPPSNAASIQRTLKFYEYLHQWGWNVQVLTAKTLAYPFIDATQQLPDSIADNTHRALALDVHRHLSIKGKHFAASKIPDRWSTWIPFATRLGKKIMRRYQPDVIWSTCPIPGAHVIAKRLATKYQVPWVADYRDPLPYMHGTKGSLLDRTHQSIDQQTLALAKRIVFATPQASQLYQSRYGDQLAEKFSVIENGFDEGNFDKLDTLAVTSPFSPTKFSLYYSGVLYPVGRDPEPVFQALAQLKHQNILCEQNFELIFQGAGDGTNYHSHMTELGVESLVRFIEPVPFLHALNNMMQADALLLIQDSKFNAQIPGKIYEYLRTGKPILLKADEQGATAKIAKDFAGCHIANTAIEIQKALRPLLTTNQPQYQRDIAQFTRESKAQQLHQILHDVTESNI